MHHPAAGATRRCPVESSTPLGPDQVHALLLFRGFIGTMFGPKRAIDEKETERRRVVAEQAKRHYQLLKATQLVLDAISWRVTDKRLEEEEYCQLEIELDDVRIKFEREEAEDLAKVYQKVSEIGQAICA
jgi:hypothetical protein